MAMKEGKIPSGGRRRDQRQKTPRPKKGTPQQPTAAPRGQRYTGGGVVSKHEPRAQARRIFSLVVNRLAITTSKVRKLRTSSTALPQVKTSEAPGRSVGDKKSRSTGRPLRRRAAEAVNGERGGWHDTRAKGSNVRKSS